MRILLIEDEPKLNEHIRKGLEQQHYQVDACTNGSEGVEMAAVTPYDLIILDLMLPGQNGFDVMDNLQKFQIKTPVIIISALNGSNRVIDGLDRGAVDYIKKPFDFGEFLARIRAVTRKSGTKNFTKYSIGSLSIDLLSRKARFENDEIELTRREFSLLELLMLNANRIVTKTEIAERIWEVNFDMGSNVIEVHLSQLRRKLGNGELIKTKVGVGYFIEGTLMKS